MSFLHSQSSECLKSELDLFSVPPTQTSIEGGGYVEYNPISSLNHAAPIEFVVNGSGQEYIDLANTQIYVKTQIVQANGDNIPNDAAVGPVNNLLHSLFSEVDVKVNDTLLSSTNNTYSYRSYLETLLTYGKDAKESQLTSSLFYKDTSGHMDVAVVDGANATNAGLNKRQTFFSESRITEMIGRIHADLFFQEKYLLSDVGLRLRFVRNKDSFTLMSAQVNASFQLRILDCKLYVRKVKISPTVFLAHARAFEIGNAKYPIKRVVCKTFTVPRGNMDFSQENLFTGQLPTRLVLGCVDNDAFNGTYIKNPFNFKHLNLSQLKVYIDGQHQYIKPLDLNFAQNQYAAAYMTLYSGTGKLFKDEGNFIERTEYCNGYTLYAFDLTPDFAEEGHFNLVKEGSVRVDIKFDLPLPRTINVIAYAEFENIIEIDRARNILFDYSN